MLYKATVVSVKLFRSFIHLVMAIMPICLGLIMYTHVCIDVLVDC